MAKFHVFGWALTVEITLAQYWKDLGIVRSPARLSKPGDIVFSRVVIFPFYTSINGARSCLEREGHTSLQVNPRPHVLW